jgi:NADH-quinone oxidoreductase subunit H
LFHDPFTFAAFWLYFTCATASCKRAPFDLAEAESELVAGFHTEYSGLRWSFFFMAEYASMFAVSGIATLLFLGGWNTGLTPPLSEVFSRAPASGFDIGAFFGNVINVGVFIVKCWLLVFVMMWVRWTLPRLRIDQVMMTCLKYLLPISCVLLLGVSVWQVFVPSGIAWIVNLALERTNLTARATPLSVGTVVSVILSGVTLLYVLVTGVVLVTTPSKLPTAPVPAWGRRLDMAQKA